MQNRLPVLACALIALSAVAFAASAQTEPRETTAAERFADRPELSRALDRALADPALRERAIADPRAFLRDARLSAPRGLELQIFEPGRLFEPPLPRVELTRCRRIYYRECDDRLLDPNAERPVCELKESEVCLGFRIIEPTPRPGPIPPIRQ